MAWFRRRTTHWPDWPVPSLLAGKRRQGAAGPYPRAAPGSVSAGWRGMIWVALRQKA
jgi:hypothetical protein